LLYTHNQACRQTMPFLILVQIRRFPFLSKYFYGIDIELFIYFFENLSVIFISLLRISIASSKEKRMSVTLRGHGAKIDVTDHFECQMDI